MRAPDTARQAAAKRLDEHLATMHPRRPLLVGQAPGRGLDGWPALTGAVGDRLGSLAGLAKPGVRGALALMFVAERVNVFPAFPGDPSGLGPGDADPFPMPAAKARAAEILDTFVAADTLRHRRVVLVGALVAQAFGHDDPLFQWCRIGWDGHVYHRVTIPHPSGRNRWWNDPANMALAGAFLSTLFLPGAHPGLSGLRGDDQPGVAS